MGGEVKDRGDDESYSGQRERDRGGARGAADETLFLIFSPAE